MVILCSSGPETSDKKEIRKLVSLQIVTPFKYNWPKHIFITTVIRSNSVHRPQCVSSKEYKIPALWL